MKILVEKNNIGIRLDKFLAQEFFSLSRGKIIKAIRNGEITVSGKINLKPSYILKENDVINSDISFEREEIVPNDKIKLRIILEDENIIAIDKPAGIQVHPDSNERENTIVNALVSKFPEIINVHDESLGAFLRPGIVHRLDKDTSGIIVVARNMETFNALKVIFHDRKIRKKYLALVFGKPKSRKGVITKAIARAGNYRKQVIAGAKTKTKVRGAVTFYKIIRAFKRFTLLEVEPKTGRMHQIRVHLTYIGHPIVGDKKYKIKNLPATPEGVERHLLHAASLEFELFGRKYKLKAETPEDFATFLKNLT
jgi:23S rRNA pseudouridine1911/1915/1917 synthase